MDLANSAIRNYGKTQTGIIVYNSRMRGFNGRIYNKYASIEFHLSSKWINISEQIQIGLCEYLMGRMFGKKRSINTDLYENFIKSLEKSGGERKANDKLKSAFDRVNKKYFDSVLDMPNLKFGKKSKRVLATYNYSIDTINVSSYFENASDLVLDYLVFHELLHKKLKFENGSVKHHHKEFREFEKKFVDEKMANLEINKILRPNILQRFKYLNF